MTRDQILARMRSFIEENFLYMRNDFELADDTLLLAGGVVDSMGVMEVVAFLEEEFGVAVDDADITEENLGSIGAIATYLAARVTDEGIRQSA